MNNHIYNREAYNKYTQVPNFSYKIIEHLMTNEKAETLWKLIKYNDANAYDKPNLTQEEKAALIYKGVGTQDEFSVFLDYMSTDANYTVKTILRIYPGDTTPVTRTTGIQGINIEVFVEFTINHLADYTTRVDRIVQILLEVLNGADIGGVGQLFLDESASHMCRISTIGVSPFKGKQIVMAVNVG